MICFLCHFNSISIRGSEYVAESATGRDQWVGVQGKAAIESGYISPRVRCDDHLKVRRSNDKNHDYRRRPRGSWIQWFLAHIYLAKRCLQLISN